MARLLPCHRTAVVLALLSLTWYHAQSQRILIKHKPDVAADILQRANAFELSTVTQAHGLTVMKNAATSQLKLDKLKLLLETARSWPGVEQAEEDQPRYMHLPLTEQQQDEDKQGCRNNNVPLSDTPVPEYLPYGISQIQGTSNKLPWRTDDKGMLICIIDSGIDVGHPDLTNDKLDGCKFQDSFAPAGCPFPWGEDYVGHGTHVAGTIAAQRNGFGVVGVIPGPAELYSVRVFNDTGDVNQGQSFVYGSTVILAFTQCEGRLAALQNAYPEKKYRMVVSMSLGAPGPLTIEQMYFREAIKRGDILFVASSGNNGTGQSLTSDGAVTTDVNPGNYPGSYPEVIAVAAVDCNNELAMFSQKNPSVDLAAPGSEIMSSASREDMPPGIMLGGFMSTSDPKIKFLANGNAVSSLGAAGAGKFTGKVADCGTGAGPCPAAKGNICLVQYDPKMKTIQTSEAAAGSMQPPEAAAATDSSRNGVQQVQQSSRWAGMFEAAQRLFSRGGSGAAGQQQQPQRQQQQQQRQQQQPQRQQPTPRRGPADEEVVQEPSRTYCETMEYCMKQGAKAMLLGPPAIASGYYGDISSLGAGQADLIQRIQKMPLFATFDCHERSCSCWGRIANAGRLPAAGLTLDQYFKVKAAVGEAAKAGRQFTGVVESKEGAYKILSGTSMAVPHVTGAIARVWAAYPDCKAETVREAFEKTAKDLGPTGRDVQFGHGLVQAQAAFNYLAGQPCAKGQQAGGLTADQKTQQG